MEVRINAGITYAELRQAINSLHPDITVFRESKEARAVPELAILLTNASNCYTTMKQLWNEALFGDSPEQRYAADVFRHKEDEAMIIIASTNIQLARKLVDAESAEIVQSTLGEVKAKQELLSAKAYFDAANRVLSGETVREAKRQVKENQVLQYDEATKRAQSRLRPIQRVRDWKDIEGNVLISGVFVSLKSGSVILKEAVASPFGAMPVSAGHDSKTIKVSVTKLCKDDRKLIADEQKRQQAEKRKRIAAQKMGPIKPRP